MPRPTPADLALVLLAAAVLTGAVRVATDDPPAPVSALTAHPTPTPTGTTVPRASKGTVRLDGPDLELLADALAGEGWQVLTDEVTSPAVVVLQIEPGTGTSERVAEAVEGARTAYPEALVVLVGPFDPEGTLTTQAVEQAARDEGVLFLDPVERAWTEGADPSLVAGDLDEELTAALAAAG